jgi:hypothetical protein
LSFVTIENTIPATCKSSCTIKLGVSAMFE